MGVWDTLRVYDRSIAADPKDRFVTNGRPGYGLAQTTPDYKDRFLSGSTPAPTVSLTTSTPTPYTDQFLRSQTSTPSAQVPSTVPAAARPTAAREVARRVVTTPAQRPVPIAQPTISYGAAYPTEGEALMTELLAANSAPAAPVNPIYGPPAGVTVMDTNGVRQVSTEGFTGRPMDEGFVGRYAAAGKDGQIVLANGGGTPRVVYKNPNAVPEGTFAGVSGVQGDLLRASLAATESGQYESPSARLSDAIALSEKFNTGYGTTQQGTYYGAKALAAPIEAQASATGAAAQMVGAQAERDSVGAKYITANAAMKQATTKENNPNGKTADERGTERWQKQYKTNLDAVNADITNMKLPFEEKAARARRQTDADLGVTAEAPATGGVKLSRTELAKLPKNADGTVTYNGVRYKVN